MTDSASNLQWVDSFLLGHAPMDALHEEFVGLIGRLQAAEPEQLDELLELLAKHLHRHFELENAWMIETDFPPRACHIDEHAAVLKSVADVREQLRAGNVDICRYLVDELANWFPSHADHLDSALAHWMSKIRFGGKPVILRRSLSLE
ncbi:hemerythrin [Paraburkholderia bengalensis]|uniref:Hemerythrin n=1 Tax=Paraburkholderia bengalensis TaxID=2747562 RepID=A0ABU8ING0_9BURK